MVPLALVVATGGGAAMTAIGASDRTADAYRDYRDRAEVGDLIINPSLSTEEVDRAIRSLPGVETVTSDSMLLAWITDASDEFQVRGSVEGRYQQTDRPVVREGRLPTGDRELLVDVEVSERRGLTVGDEITMSFGSPRTEFEVGPDAMPTLLGTEVLQVVGIATFSDEVLPEQLYPRGVVVVSRDVAERYDCFAGVPPDGTLFRDAIPILIPDGCAVLYRYYSLGFRDGAAGVPPALAAYAASIERLNAAFPDLTQDPEYPLPQNLGYFQITTNTQDELRRVERAIRPSIVALLVLGAATAIVTVVLGALAAARELRRADAEQPTWRAIGLTTAQRAAVVAVPLGLAVLVGGLVASAGAWVASTIAPVGVVAVVEPFDSRRLTGPAWLTMTAIALLLTIAIMVVAGRSARRAVARSRRSSRPTGRLFAVVPRPVIAEGLRAALGRGRGSLLVVTLGIVTGAVSLASVIFGASLVTLVSTPSSYGWPWDAAVVFNFGYGGVDVERTGSALGGRPEVERWSALAFVTPVIVDGEPTPGLASLDRSSPFGAIVTEGRAPAASDEVALGALTAAERDIEVGDRVAIAADGVAERRSLVTGLVTLPALGPFQSDRTGPGRGVLLPESVLGAAAPVNASATFVGMDLVPGTDAAQLLDDLGDEIASWSTNGFPPTLYDHPIQPPEIVDATSMRVVPAVVGGLLVVAATIGLSMSLAVSVRARRRDLSVLHALGFTRAQLRGSVAVQAGATIAVAMAAAVPLGIVVGRIAWRAFAGELGVSPAASVPAGSVVIAVVAPMIVALLAAALPARTAANVAPTASLRPE